MRNALGALVLCFAPALVPSLAGVAAADKRAPSDRQAASPNASQAAVEGDDDDDPATGNPSGPPPIAVDGERPREAVATDEVLPVAPSAPAMQPTYRGVAPGTEGLPPRAPHLPARGPSRMTWPGFVVQNGVATVFLQLTAEPEWAAIDHPDKIVYTLRRTTVPLANNRRPLDVGEFGTVVKSVSARRRGRDVEVTIQLKQKATHRERTGEAAGGYRFLVIELLPS